ncbi:MAG: MetQ/NlpA family ABC transporter substrate-binding protein [Christensenellales bacterium]|jgi:D-methionine transport system substrate-binding protein
MKRTFILILSLLLAVALFAGCTAQEVESPSPSAPAKTDEAPAVETETGESEEPEELVTLKIGATAVPHAEILEFAKPLLAQKGVDLEILIFDDYVLPNTALFENEIDANFFQHLPYLENFNAQNKTDLISAVAVHYEPLGIYPGKTASFEDLKDGAQIAVPNDTTNEARALKLLEVAGLIKLKADAGFDATVRDIAENPRKFKIVELDAAQIPRSLPDVELAVINGNYALQASLNAEDALATEAKDSDATSTFANIVAIRSGDESRPEIQALIEVLTGEDVKAYINDTYSGSVLPIF